MKCEGRIVQHVTNKGQRKKRKRSLIPLSLLMMTCTVPDASSMQDTCHKNSVKCSWSLCVLIPQFIGRPPGVWEVTGSIFVGDSDFSFVPRLWHVEQFTFHIPCTLFHSTQELFTNHSGLPARDNYSSMRRNSTTIPLDLKTINFFNYVPLLDLNVAVEGGMGTCDNSWS